MFFLSFMAKLIKTPDLLPPIYLFLILIFLQVGYHSWPNAVRLSSGHLQLPFHIGNVFKVAVPNVYSLRRCIWRVWEDWTFWTNPENAVTWSELSQLLQKEFSCLMLSIVGPEYRENSWVSCPQWGLAPQGEIGGRWIGTEIWSLWYSSTNGEVELNCPAL